MSSDSAGREHILRPEGEATILDYCLVLWRYKLGIKRFILDWVRNISVVLQWKTATAFLIRHSSGPTRCILQHR